MLMELGVCLTVKHGALYVWAHIDINEITFIHVSQTSSIHEASGELDKKLCHELYPELWSAVENKIAANIEVDDGI